MSLVLNESVVLAKTRSQDLKSVLKLNCWGSGIKDVSLVRQLINVEVIGLSCNEITTLEDFAHCKKLKELILRNNKIKNIAEVAHLQKLPNLTSLWLGENPCVETTYNYRKVVLKALPQLKVLDNLPVTHEELQEIEELGNDIYEEVPYESTSSHSSGPPSHGANNNGSGNKAPVTQQANQQQPARQISQPSFEAQTSQQVQAAQHQDVQQLQPSEQQHQQPVNHCDSSFNEMSLYQPTTEFVNDTLTSNDCSAMMNRSSRMLQTQSQGSMNALNNANNNQFSAWSNCNVSGNNNNNSSFQMLPKGGKSRNANILSAVLCLVKELDYVSCEVVQTALHCRMEETAQ